MSQTYLKQIKRGIPLLGGLRKRCFLIEEKGEKLVFCLWPKGSLPKKKIQQAIKLELLARKRGFPCRRWLKTGKAWIREIRFEERDYWLGVGNYLAGKPCGQWTPEYLLSAGRTLAQFHRSFQLAPGKTLLHLDFARGNILFDKDKKVCGILDFEEAAWGEPEKDIACSLSFFIVDCKGLPKEEIEKKFLEGYKKSGKIKPNLRKVRSHLQYYLELRRKEMAKSQKSPPRFLQEAKKRWAAYQEKTRGKIVRIEDLIEIRKKQKDRKIVFALGAWELVHWGHLSFLEEAKKQGDIFVVGVATNESRRRLKGIPHPLISETTRAETLAYFSFVDWIVICDEDNAIPVLRELKPDIFYTASVDWKKGLRTKKEEELIKKFKGKIIKRAYLKPNISSSSLVQQVALIKIRQAIEPLWQKGLESPLLKPQLSQRGKENQLILFEK